MTAETNGPGREPTPAMVRAGLNAYSVTGGDLWADTEAIWRAMWDAAPPPAETPAPAPADALVEALELVLAQSGADQGAPDHCHSKPGVWDNDSGNRSVGRAGQVCRECGVWDRARAALAALRATIEQQARELAAYRSSSAAQMIASAERRAERAERENDVFLHSSVAEIATRNVDVRSYMEHWEWRTKRAEGEAAQNFDEWQAEKKRAERAESLAEARGRAVDAANVLFSELRVDHLGIADALPHFKTAQAYRAALAAIPKE